MSFKMWAASVGNRESCAQIAFRKRWISSSPRQILFDCRPTASLPLAVLLPWLPFVSGCGPHSDRHAVSGKITLNGAALDEGEVRFASVGGEKVSASGTHIANGQYQIPQEKGLRPGTYRVEMSAPDNSKPAASTAGRDSPGPPPLRKSESRPNTIPTVRRPLRSPPMGTTISTLILRSEAPNKTSRIWLADVGIMVVMWNTFAVLRS